MEDDNLDEEGELNFPIQTKSKPLDYIDNEDADLKGDALSLNVTQSDLSDSGITDFEKKVFLNEMESCDMYLHNLHKTFKYVTTVNSVIKLVAASLVVHKHRRSVMEKTSKIKVEDEDTIEFDNMGRVIKKVS